MSERIIKSSISIFEAMNDLRNNKSLAHDNPTLSIRTRHGSSSTASLPSYATSSR